MNGRPSVLDLLKKMAKTAVETAVEAKGQARPGTAGGARRPPAPAPMARPSVQNSCKC